MKFTAAKVRQMQLWKASLLAFIAMCFQDVLGTCMVVFEAHYNAALAGAFDVMGWFFGIICSALALESIIKTGWRTRRSLILMAAITCANFLGTWVGVLIGEAITHH